MDHHHRAGRYVRQTTGYQAFVPAPLPPEPPLAYDGLLQTLLSAADRDIGRLDALASLLPNPDLFVAMYVRHEAVLSSQIEGTQSTLEDVLAFEADAVRDDTPRDVEEVVNYVRAMNHGLKRLPELPLSLYLKARRAEYYDRLTAIREQGHWEAWVAFFLRGVSGTAQEATRTAQQIVALRDAQRSAVARQAKALTLIDHLLQQPTVSIKRVGQLLGCTVPTAGKLVREFESRGWLHELTGYGRNRLWRYQPYVELFHRDTLGALTEDSASFQTSSAH